jgi:hypothetical protein
MKKGYVIASDIKDEAVSILAARGNRIINSNSHKTLVLVNRGSFDIS